MVAKAVKHCLQCAVVVPLIEVPPHCGFRGEFVGHIAPWRTRVEDPENTVDYVTRIPTWSTHAFRWWEQIRDQIPLLIREPMSKHEASFPHAV